MTHTLIATNTLDACIRICPPPPPQHTHSFAKAYAQHNTQHTMSRVGRVGKRPNTSTAQTPPDCQAISPPPFHVVVWVVGPLLVVLKVREGVHFLFAVVLGFFDWGEEVGTH